MKLKSEVALSLLNRMLPPIVMLAALSIVEGQLDALSFGHFLVLYSVYMWVLTCLYQWKKNSLIRFISNEREDLVSVSVLFFVVFSFVAFPVVFYFSGVTLLGFIVSLSVVSSGMLFFNGALLRMQGGNKTFLLTDTLSNVLRWILLIPVCFLFDSLEAAFLAFFLGISTGLVLQLRSISFPEFRQSLVTLASVKEYFLVVLPLFMLGFSSAAFIYADRFFQSFENDAAFILASTIATQSVSIVCGALVMVVFPRLALSFRDNKVEFYRQWALLNKFSVLVILTAMPAVLLGVFVIDLFFNVSFERNPYYTVSMLAVAHSLYYMIHFLSLPMLIIGKQFFVTILLFIGFIVFCFLSYLGADVLIAKVICMVAMSILMFANSIRYLKIHNFSLSGSI